MAVATAMTQPQRCTPLTTPTSMMVAAVSICSVFQMPASGGCLDVDASVAMPHPAEPPPTSDDISNMGRPKHATMMTVTTPMMALVMVIAFQ
jgi:hypothetical protein